jgi:hypothetical protein
MTPARTHDPDTALDGTLPDDVVACSSREGGSTRMSVEVARRTRRRAPTAGLDPEPIASPASISIGELDQTVFACPACGRPLALGARRCPGCHARLVNGITLGKAAGFVAAGLVVGLLLGGGGGLLLFLGSSQAGGSGPSVAAGPSAATPSAPTASVGPPASASVAPTSTPASAIPPVTRSALVQVVAMNGRLSTAAADLRAALAARVLDASAAAQILRTVSADSLFGEQLAQRVSDWPASNALGSQLAEFYGTIHDTATNGLVASVQNKAAYRAAATAMIKRLDGLPAIGEAVRSLAASAGLQPVATFGPTSAP